MRTGVARGIDSRLEIDGTQINLEKWQVATVSDDIPALGFEDVAIGLAYDIGDTGVATTTFSASGYWDRNLVPHDSPPSIFSGAILENMRCYTSFSDATFYNFGEVRMLQVQVNMELRTRADLAFVGKVNGAFTYPGGQIATQSILGGA